MRKRFVCLSLWGCGVALLLSPLVARAEFLIEFLDGHTVTVGQYFEEKSVIKVYMPQGSIGFPKSEVKRILSVDENGAGVPLETVSTRRPSESSTSNSLTDEGSAEGTGKDTEAAKQKTGKAEGEGGKGAKMTYEEAGEKYQEVQQQLATLWDKHIQDVNQNASEEVLTENRRQMNALDSRRRELVKTGREENSGNLPDWAQ